MSMTLQPTLAVGFIPPPVALFLTVCLIIFLFRRDIRQRPNVTGALWLPLVWMFIICSRQPSEWLSLFGLDFGGKSLEEGSPLDACVYLSLIAAGTYVLHTRRVQLFEIIRNNQWLTIFFVYCFLAIFWSDFPFVSFKRWIKVIGHPVMALIILTEPDVIEALMTLMKRCAYIIVSVSIAFIRYFPQWGRGFDQWSGAAMNTGISTNKNALGCDCLILGFFFVWYFLQVKQMEQGRAKRHELFLAVTFLAAIWWLLSLAQSSTSSVSLVLSASILWVLGLRSINKRLIGTYLVVAVIAIVIAQGVFGVYEHFLHFLHKNPTLTDRTLLWQELLKFDINPLFGTGFESFFLGRRLQALQAKLWWAPNEAHNGYLETYLNLGLLGLFLFVGLLAVIYAKARAALFENFEIGRFRFALLFAIIVYNWTEAAVKNISPMFFLLFIIALDCPAHELSAVSYAGDVEFEEQPELAQPGLELQD
jgi:exopolysaccharide production protein ExoQ